MPDEHEHQADEITTTGDSTGAGDETSTMEVTGPIGTPQPHTASQVRRITATNGEA